MKLFHECARIKSSDRNSCDFLEISGYVPPLRLKVFICDWIWEKLASIHTTARYNFHYQMVAAHINNSSRYWCWKLPRLLLLWLAFKACQTSTSAQVIFERLHHPLISRQPAVREGWGRRGGEGWLCYPSPTQLANDPTQSKLSSRTCHLTENKSPNIPLKSAYKFISTFCTTYFFIWMLHSFILDGLIE